MIEPCLNSARGSSKCYGLRSTAALLLPSMYKGTEIYSCVTIHLPSIVRWQAVTRTQTSVSSIRLCVIPRKMTVNMGSVPHTHP